MIADLPALQPIRLRRGELHCRMLGSGPPLLLLHGWGASSRCWSQTLCRLQERFTLIAPDLPGFGESPPFPGVASNEELAAVTLELADALGLERFLLNGHSFCAGVAALVAAQAPERVERLVLTCFSVWHSERERRVVATVHRLLGLWLALRRPWQLRRPLFQRMLGRRLFYRLPDDPALLRAGLEDFLRMDYKVGLESAVSAAIPTFHAALRSIQAPTLLVAARQDQIMPPANTPIVAELIPDCRLVWIERCGHLPMIERAQLYHRLLLSFLYQDARRSVA